MSKPLIDERWVERHRPQHEPSPMLRHMRIPLHCYWLWLVVFFCFIGMIPWHATQKMPSQPVQYLTVGAYNHWYMFDWQSTLIVHSLLAILLATAAAVIQIVKRRVRGESEHVTYSLRQLLTATGFLALILGLLAWCAAPPTVLGAVTLSFSGWPTAIVLAGLITRRIMARRETVPKVDL